MVGETTKVGTGQAVWKDEISIGQTLGVDPDMTIIIEMEILEVMWDSIKILRGRILEKNIETVTEVMIITEIEVGLGLGRENFQKYKQSKTQ